MAPVPARSGRKAPKVTKKFTINASQPASDKIFDVSAFEKFLHDRIKVEGRVGNLGDKVNISQTGDGKVEVVAHIPFSGRYLKYLFVPPPHHNLVLVALLGWPVLTTSRTKKFLKKQQLRDWLRVVSTARGTYELRFYNVVNDEGDEEEE
ncbi:60S ribosomal protein L22 [Aspergillus sp. HF37]|nr:60S ribosomal protein L22 [Aspergillus sp. HF37]